MYERFTDRSRKVMMLANQEAQRFNHTAVDTQHLLLGLIKEGTGTAAGVLQELGVDLRAVRVASEKLAPGGPDVITMGKLPQTDGVRRVLDYALQEAAELKHNYVGTEHLLLGLLRDQEGVAYRVLGSLGVSIDAVRFGAIELIGPKEPTRDPPPEEFRGTEVDDLKLLRLLCRMANMSHAGVRKAVLVCEVGAAPVVYIESFLQPVDEAAMQEVVDSGKGVRAEEVAGIVVDTTSVQNKLYVTKATLPISVGCKVVGGDISGTVEKIENEMTLVKTHNGYDWIAISSLTRVKS